MIFRRRDCLYNLKKREQKRCFRRQKNLGVDPHKTLIAGFGTNIATSRALRLALRLRYCVVTVWKQLTMARIIQISHVFAVHAACSFPGV